jgi:rhamnulose-1-phosphate aldolase
MMKKHDLDDKLFRIIRSAQEVAGRLWDRGWAEKNAGNFSINISFLQLRTLKLSAPSKLGRRFPALARQSLLVTATGSRMRDLARDPMPHLGIIRIGERGETYQTVVLDRDRPRFTPTSELPSHLAIQESFLKRRTDHRVVLHTHPDELVALTHLPAGRTARDLNRILRTMHPEVPCFLPGGVGLVHFLKPGSSALGEASVREFQRHDIVLWAKHGCLAAGSDIVDIFDLIDVLNKAAKIFFLCRRDGFNRNRS